MTVKEIFYLGFLLCIHRTVCGSEILDKYESRNYNTTGESILKQYINANTTNNLTEFMQTLVGILDIVHPGMLNSSNSSGDSQLKNLIHKITQNSDYNTFLRQNVGTKFLDPQKMSYLQNVTLSFLYSLSRGHKNDSKFIDEVHWLTEFETKRMFLLLSTGFNFSEEVFNSILSNYITYKKNGLFNEETSLQNKYKSSILVDSLHIFYLTEGRVKCISEVSTSTCRVKSVSPITFYTLFTNSKTFNEDREVDDNINQVNSSDNSHNHPLNSRANIQDNLDKLTKILKIIGQTRNGENVLHWASKKGYLDIVREILSTGSIDVNSRNNARWSALQLAAKEGHLSVVRELLDSNASVNSQDKNGDTPLHWASWEGHVSVVDTLLQRNADVNIQNRYGNTPLSWAAWGGKINVARLLLMKNAKIDLKNYDEGWTSLHRAAEKGQLEVIDEFLSSDPSLANIRDNRYRTAYDVAKEYDHEEVADFIKSFMNKPEITEDATLEIKDIVNKTLITGLPNNTQIEVESQSKKFPNRYKIELERTAEEGDVYAVKYILKHFGVSFFQDENGTSPLHLASKSGHVRVVRELLTYKTTIDSKDNNGWTPLHFAAKVGSLSIVKLLLEKNASVNAQTKNGDTPLHWAAWGDYLPVVKELVEKNAFVNAENKWGNTPLSWASWNGNLEVVKFLLDNNAKVHFRSYDEGWSSIHRAVEQGHKAVAMEFFSRDPCVLYLKDNRGNYPYMLAAESGYRGLSDYLRLKMNKNIYNCNSNIYSMSDISGNAPIHWAALEGNLDSVKMILSQYIWYVDRKKINGDTPLHLASKEGHIEIIEELISSGASVNSTNNAGKTPLHLAAVNGKLLAVMELLENNATADSKDSNGDSPLHWAVWEGHLAVIEELIERNASVNIQNSYGNTPVSWAAWAGRVDAIELLMKHGADIELKNFDEGFNALHRAAEHGQIAAAKALLAKNPSLISVKDNRKRTPYDVAKEKKHEELAEYLKSLMDKDN